MAKVLLVEDDNNLREIYEARLQAEGYEISSAQDGEEALVVAKQFKPDLIISDVMMPKISGFEMLDILRNTEGLEHTRVIMLTALGQAEDKTRADTLGADRYLVKSQVTLEDIVKSAHEILDGDAAVPAPVGDSTTAAGVATASDDTATPPTTPAASVPEPATTNTSTVPVADAPAEEPAPEPATPPAATESAAVPGTTANEQAAVDEQIQDFIKNTPVETPVAEPAAADDALLSEAADSLAGEAAEKTLPAEPVADAPAETPKPQSTNDNVTIAHKKVIAPPSQSDKPSLNELLAKEEAKESGLPVTPTAAPDAAVPAEAEEFKLPEGASEESSPVPEPASAPELAVMPEPTAEPMPAAEAAAKEAPAEPATPPPAAVTEPAAAEQTATAPAPETPSAAATPKNSDDFDPHSVAL